MRVRLLLLFAVGLLATVSNASAKAADSTPPVTTIQCNGGNCGSTAVAPPASFTLSATDPDDPPANIVTRYTTDGSDPTTASTTYSGPVTLSTGHTTTVKYRSWDSASNVEATQTRVITVATPKSAKVSLTFDDGIETQYLERSILAGHGMHGTFYINSGNVGASNYYMTWPQIHDIAAAGNEIGGHTFNHPRLTSLAAPEVLRQICDDRTTLRDQGFGAASSFAYPYGAFTTDVVEPAAAQCGYASARRLDGIKDPVDCPDCPYKNALPVADPHAVRTPTFVTRPITLSDLEGWVMDAENHGGGWIPIVFHDICVCSKAGSVSPADLNAFLDWMKTTANPAPTVVTVNQVIGPAPPCDPTTTTCDTTPPMTTIACNGSACSGATYPYGSPVSVTLVASDSGSGVVSTHYTTDGSDPTTLSPVYGGPISVATTTTLRFRSWDAAENAEPVHSQQISIAGPAIPASPPPTGASCGIACTPTTITGRPPVVKKRPSTSCRSTKRRPVRRKGNTKSGRHGVARRSASSAAARSGHTSPTHARRKPPAKRCPKGRKPKSCRCP